MHTILTRAECARILQLEWPALHDILCDAIRAGQQVDTLDAWIAATIRKKGFEPRQTVTYLLCHYALPYLAR